MIESDAIALRAILSALWGGRWVLAASTAFCVLLGIGYLHVAQPKYMTTLKVVPINGGGGLDSRLGGIASLAGISLPRSGQEAEFEFFLEGLKSREVAIQIARDRDFLIHMFPKEWDARSRRWKRPESATRSLVEGVESFLGVPIQPWQPPGPQRVLEYLNKEVNIAQEDNSNVVAIRMETPQPAFAERLLAALAHHSDEYCRQRLIQRTGDYIDYLERKLRIVTIEEYRSALLQIMSDQEKQRMMASSDLPFSADMFGSPATSRQPSSPKALLVLLASFAIGSFIGTIIIMMRLERPSRSE